jgi:ubiquinone/menaquinone biosynthesis C-methylase UbiE
MSATVTPVNYWRQDSCARAFWNQHELRPYQELLHDTVDWLEPQPGEHWLDLGCGSGRLSRKLWEKSAGSLDEIVAIDCAALNAIAYERLREEICRPTDQDRIRFVCGDFLAGLATLADQHFNGVVSGLAIHYAESFSPELGRWTTDAYDSVLAEVNRILRPGGCFVFSVMVPKPSWTRVAWSAVGGVFGQRQPMRSARKAWRMWRYGPWLSREARSGRFHYLPIDTVRAKLQTAGFDHIEHRLSYARQSYLVRCCKSGKRITSESISSRKFSNR